MGSFVFVAAVPSGAFDSVRVASNSCFPYGVKRGTFDGGFPEGGNSFANTLCVFSKSPPSLPTPGAMPCQTPDRSRGLNGIPGGLNLSSSLVCAGVKHCGHVFHPGGGNSVCAAAFEDRASPAAKTNVGRINWFRMLFVWHASIEP